MKLKYFFAGLLLLATSAAFGQYTYWGFTYSMSVPMGNIDNYITAGSFRGANIEGFVELDENLAVGWLVGWNTFYEKRDNETYVNDNATLTGTQYRYLNAFPILVRGLYSFGAEYTTRPYIGAGLGITPDVVRTDVGLYSFSKDATHFTMAPEIGINVPYEGGAVIASVRYIYGVKTKDIDAISYFSFNLGFVFGGL